MDCLMAGSIATQSISFLSLSCIQRIKVCPNTEIKNVKIHLQIFTGVKCNHGRNWMHYFLILPKQTGNNRTLQVTLCFVLFFFFFRITTESALCTKPDCSIRPKAGSGVFVTWWAVNYAEGFLWNALIYQL